MTCEVSGRRKAFCAGSLRQPKHTCKVRANILVFSGILCAVLGEGRSNIPLKYFFSLENLKM